MTDANNLYKGVLKAVEGSKWKQSSQHASIFILPIVFTLQDILTNRTYESKRDVSFILHERGKIRTIDSFPVEDRAIRHVLCDDIFASEIRKRIIYDNGASVEGRGISHTRKRFEAHLRKYYMQHRSNNGYILFGDYSKYYDNILHEVAIKQLLDLVDNDEFIGWLLATIFKQFEIDCSDLTQEEYEQLYDGVLDKLVFNPEKSESPTKTLKKSISIGDQLSQQIGIYYPHEIDNYIKIVKGIKYYGRYMDDWYIIGETKEELMELLDAIIDRSAKIGLHVNKRKTYLTKLNSRYKFLQVKYTLMDSGKIIKRMNPRRVTAMRTRLKKLAIKVQNGSIEYDNVENMYRAWMGSFHKLLSTQQRKNLIDLYQQLFDKKIYIVGNKMIITEGVTV